MTGLSCHMFALCLALGPAGPPASGGSTRAVAPLAPVAPRQPPDGIRSAVRRILAGREYRQLRRQAARQKDETEAGSGCKPKKRSAEPPSVSSGCRGVGTVVSAVVYLLVLLLLLAAVVAIAWLIGGFLRRRRATPEPDEETPAGAEASVLPATPPGERPSAVYLNRARSLADAGDYRGAIRQLLLGAMSWTERRGLIQYRMGLTNRDYRRALQGHTAQQDGLGGVSAAFEEVYFGRRAATAERYARCLNRYRTGFDVDDSETSMAR